MSSSSLSRPRRSNAGSKMASLLDEEERRVLRGDEDFYSSTYGGFAEEEDDKEFHYESPVEGDTVDSDFSIDENDEPRSDAEGEGESGPKRVKRGKGVQTKAYKEPPRKKKPPPTPREDEIAPPKAHKVLLSDFNIHRRASTLYKSAETLKRIKERDALSKRRLKKMQKNKKPEPAPLTQEQILEECKLTEKLNMESLKRFQEMELENRKKAKFSSKRKMEGPFIRYHSIATPLIASGSDSDEVGEGSSKGNRDKKQERTFITFSESEGFEKAFPKKKRHSAMPGNTSNTSQKMCPITRLPAKYFDPVTRLPYANLQAFRILREAYYNQLEAKGDRSDPEIAAWVEWRQKNRSAAKPPVMNQVSRPPQVFSQLLSSVNRLNASSSSIVPAVSCSLPQVHPPSIPHQQTVAAVVSASPGGGLISRPIVVSAQQIFTTTSSVSTASSSSNVVALQVAASGTSSGQFIRSSSLNQQQSIVLPVRTTPLTSHLQQSSTVAIPTSTIQTVKIGGQNAQVSWSGNTLQLPRTVATTTLTAQQLQQLAASRGQVLTSALHTALRTGAIAQRGGTQLIATRPQTTVLRPQQVRQGPTIALQRPARSQTISLQPASGRAAGQIIMGQAVSSASNVSSPGRQIVVAAGGSASSPRQIVMTHGGQQVRQVLQVTGQGGQQHQIVVSQGGQIILNPPNSKS